MKVNIIRGPHTDENIQKCYHILADKARKEIYREGDLWKGFDGRTAPKRLWPRQSD